jgi:hypothetical protein
MESSTSPSSQGPARAVVDAVVRAVAEVKVAVADLAAHLADRADKVDREHREAAQQQLHNKKRQLQPLNEATFPRYRQQRLQRLRQHPRHPLKAHRPRTTIRSCSSTRCRTENSKPRIARITRI